MVRSSLELSAARRAAAARRASPGRAGAVRLIAGGLGIAAGILAGSSGAGAVTATSEYVVGSIPLPATSAADLAFAGSSILVGQGSFGVGLQSIARVERDGSSTSLVTGLNALGGLDWDPAGNRLLFTDNGGNLGGAATGDTVFALAAPLSAVGPVAAVGHELRPAGSIPFAQAVLALPGGEVLVGDAAGFGLGRIVSLSGVATTDLITGLDYQAGITLAASPAGEILVGDSDSTTFAGSIDRYTGAGVLVAPLVGGLSGIYDQAIDAAGNLIVSGGFTGDFQSSTLVRVTPAGATSQIASGFGFSSGMDIDAPSGQIGVLDFGAAAIDTLTPVSGMTPGGSARGDCQLETWGARFDTSGSGKPRTTWTCVDGADCDRDTAIGSCTFLVGACFTLTDSRLPACAPAGVDSVVIASAKSPSWLPALQAAAGAVLPTTSAARCGAGVPVLVPAGRSLRISFKAVAAGRTVDRDGLALRCKRA